MSEEQNVYVAHLNNVRKAWVSEVLESTKEKFKTLSQETRFEIYREIDGRVVEKLNELLYTARHNGEKVKVADVLPLAVSAVIAQYN